MAASTEFWNGKKVLVTGGAGFIGSYLTEQLVALGAKVRITSYKGLSPEEERNIAHIHDQIEIIAVDLTNLEDAKKACEGQDVVMNLAAHFKGVEYNSKHPATTFRDNMWLGTVVLEAARLAGVKRFLVVSSAVVYPTDAPVPTPESASQSGEPAKSNEGYGWAKRMSEYVGKSYAEEFGMEIAIARPYNAFGPRDHFDSVNGHVIPALITRIANGENPLTVWGTGTPTRSFIYAEDFARGLIETTEKYAASDPVNIGSAEEISIKDLAQLIVDEMGSSATLSFDTTKPNGHPRGACDVKKATEKVGFTAEVSLREGIKKTIAWYQEHKLELD